MTHAAMMSVFDLFNTMEDEFRLESAQLVEYVYCPEGKMLICWRAPPGGTSREYTLPNDVFWYTVLADFKAEG
jgi:hypothetical protein